jgi:hypothetical protein
MPTRRQPAQFWGSRATVIEEAGLMASHITVP